MKRVRRIVRGLNWSIRLERLEDRLPLDGGLGAITQGQPQSINYDYSQIQAGYWTNQSSTIANFRLNGGSGQEFFYGVLQFSDGLSAAEIRTDEIRNANTPTNAGRDFLTVVESNGTEYVPIPNPVMISLPDPTELIAISNPNDGTNATPIREITQIAKGQDTKAQKTIEQTLRIGESNRATESTQGILENVGNNTIAPSHTMRERGSVSEESSIRQPVENIRSVSSEHIARTTESRANRISRDMYYEKTDVANNRQELEWTTDVLASATRQQVISESSALLAIIASNVSKSSMFNDQPYTDTDLDQVQPNVRLVSHVPQVEPWIGDLETNYPP